MLGHFKKRGESWYFWVELERGADQPRCTEGGLIR